MITEPYLQQIDRWPAAGRHILAQYDDDSIVVYQAYRPSIGHSAAKEGRFGGGGFGFGRMSWIKPNFLWMMYRCGWGTKEGQEVVLAVRLPRAMFAAFLAEAVPSTNDPARYATEKEWKRAVDASDVRLQWDPDHDPAGVPQERRAVQLGLRRAALRRYAEGALSIEDISPFVAEQRRHIQERDWKSLVTPREAVYPVGGGSGTGSTA